MKLSGSVRTRYEAVDGQVRPGFEDASNLISVRSTLFAEYDFGAVRVGGELYDSRAFGANQRTPVSTNEVNAAELVQAYVALDLTEPLGRGTSGSIQAGRFLLIRSERRLCEEVHLNLAYRWFCRLGLDGDVPDHSTFSKNRHGRFRDSDLLRELFETVLRRCMAEGLVGGEGFAVDASLIKADANRQRCVPGDEGLPPEAASRAIDEYLAVLDDAAFGGATPVTPKFISPADPASRWTGANKGLAFFAYATNYLIDLDHAIIVDVEPSTAVRQAEVTAARTMIERAREHHDLWPARLAADTAYGSAEMLDWLVHDQGIEPHIPVIDKSERIDGTFSRADFAYDHAADLYRCPGGKELKQHRRPFRADHPDTPPDNTYRYRASKMDCDACALKSRCCPNLKLPSAEIALGRFLPNLSRRVVPGGASRALSRLIAGAARRPAGGVEGSLPFARVRSSRSRFLFQI